MKKQFLQIIFFSLAIGNTHGMGREEFTRLLKDNSSRLAILSYAVCGASLATNVTLHTIVKKLKRYKKRSANPKKVQRWITILSGTNKGALVLTCASGIIGTVFLGNTIYTKIKNINDASKQIKVENDGDLVDGTEWKIPVDGNMENNSRQQQQLRVNSLRFLQLVRQKLHHPTYPLLTKEEEDECNKKFEKHKNDPKILTAFLEHDIKARKIGEKHKLQGWNSLYGSQETAYISRILWVTEELSENLKKMINAIYNMTNLDKTNKPLFDEVVHLINHEKLSDNVLKQIKSTQNAKIEFP